MALEPNPRSMAARLQHQLVGAGMVHDLLHQPAGGAGAAQGRVGLDMRQHIFAVPDAVIGPGRQAIFFQPEAALVLVVDHSPIWLLGARGTSRATRGRWERSI